MFLFAASFVCRVKYLCIYSVCLSTVVKYNEQWCLFKRQAYNERKTIFHPSVIKHQYSTAV